MNSFDVVIDLIDREVQRDSYGQEKLVDSGVRTVMGMMENLSNFLYFSSNMSGMKLDGVYLIHQVEYAGERVVEIGGVRYEVKRSRPVIKHGYRLIELTVGEADGVR